MKEIKTHYIKYNYLLKKDGDLIVSNNQKVDCEECLKKLANENTSIKLEGLDLNVNIL